MQKPHQNHPKPIPKSTQNDPQTDPGGTWNRTWHLLDASWKAEHQPTGVHRPVAKTGLPRVSYAPKSGVTTPSGLRRFFFQQKMSPFAKMRVFVCGEERLTRASGLASMSTLTTSDSRGGAGSRSSEACSRKHEKKRAQKSTHFTYKMDSTVKPHANHLHSKNPCKSSP